MFVIVTYDVGAKRVGKALKICRKYLFRVQNSVFEGTITPARLERLKAELQKMLDLSHDSVCVYRFGYLKYAFREQIGVPTVQTTIIQ
jgi:CRISPR-associated protein Cas2